MGFFTSLKGPLLGLVMVVAYSCFVLDIIQILKVTRGEGGYPPAVVALLVASLMQSLYLLYPIISGFRGNLNKASTHAGIMFFFFVFVLASTIPISVLKGRDQYCGARNVIRDDCLGVMKATEALGYSLAGLTLLYIAYLAALVSKHGNWSTQLWDIPAKPRHNPDWDKAPTH